MQSVQSNLPILTDLTNTSAWKLCGILQRETKGSLLQYNCIINRKNFKGLYNRIIHDFLSQWESQIKEIKSSWFLVVLMYYLESYCFAVSALSLHRFCVFCISQHYKTSCGCNFLVTSSYKATENKSTRAISFATEPQCKIRGHHLYWIFQSSMKNTSYSRAISGSGAWLHSPSWERPASLAASQFIWSDPFILSVNGCDSTNPNQYLHLLTTNTSPSNFTAPAVCPLNTETGPFIPAFPPARGSLHPLISRNHLAGQHLDLLLFCWCLCEQEQWSLQRWSTIPQTTLIISFEIITFHLHLPERKEKQ